MSLVPCSTCGRHVRIRESACVFCAAPRAAIAGVALVVAIGAGAAIGCADPAPPSVVSPPAAVYGGPPPGPDDRDASPPSPPSPSTQPTASSPSPDDRAAPAYGIAPPPPRK